MSEASGNTDAQESTRKAELDAKIRKRVACEERAFRIVEKLLETTVTADYLTDCGRLITPSHYADIVEERAITDLCGYPVCDKPLGKLPQQKYFISTKSNTVYDITERKNFCSNKCFKASKYFEKQIPTTPFWLREREQPEELKILDPEQNVGSPGYKVVGTSTRSALQNEVGVLNKLDQLDDDYLTVASAEGPVTPTSGNDSEVKTKTGPKTTEEERSTNATDALLSRETTESAKTSTIAQTSTGVNKRAGVETESIASSLSKSLTLNPDSQQSDKTEKKVPTGDGSRKCIDDTSLDSSKRSSNVGSADAESGLISSETTPDSQSSKVTPDSSSSKTEYLMKLLNKRKKLLSAMIDEQPLQTVEVKNTPSALETNSTPVIFSESLEIKEKNVGMHMKSDKKVECTNNDASQTHVTKPDSTAKEYKMLPENENIFQKQFPKMSPQIVLVCSRISEWVSKDTLKYLGLLKPTDECEVCSESNTKESEFENTEKAFENSDKLSTGDMHVGENQHSSENPTRLTDVPDYQTLRQQNDEFTLKVKEFYKGTAKRATPKADGNIQGEDTSVELVLPPVDSIAQMRIRRKIVLEKLERSLPEMLLPLDLAIQHISSELRELVSTFSLTSTNITFKPGEWTLVALLLVRMLSYRVFSIQKSFREGKSLRFYSVFLKTLGCSWDDMEKLVLVVLKQKSL